MSGGVRGKGGQQLAFTLEVFSGAETSIRQAEIIQQDYAKIGIDGIVVNMPDVADLGKVAQTGEALRKVLA